jgi:hypothetical protein
MKSLRIALPALMLAVCHVQSVQAMLSLVHEEVTRLADPAPGFEAFKVTLVATLTSPIGGVRSVSLTGAHQIWQNPAASATQTPIKTDAAAGDFGNPSWVALDTHLLIDPRPGGDRVTFSPGFGLVETNDLTNPVGLSADFLAPLAPFDTFPASAGIGDLEFVGGSEPHISWLLPIPETADLAYVVVPAGKQALLKMRLLSDFYGWIDVIDLAIGSGIPEPATGALLGWGLLAIAFIAPSQGFGNARRRKRRLSPTRVEAQQLSNL